MVAYTFNAQQYEPSFGGGSQLPAGPEGQPVKYKVVIVDTRQEPTSKGDGGFLACDLKSLEGPTQGMLHTLRLNLHNPNAKAVEIANKQLSAICHVTGIYNIQDTVQLHNIPFVVEIRPQKNEPQYTEVGAVFDINGYAAGKAPVGGQAAQSAPPPQQFAPPPAQVAPSGPAPGGWAPQPGQPAQAAPAQAAPNPGGWAPQPNASGPAPGWAGR